MLPPLYRLEEAGIEPGKVCVTTMIPPEAGNEPGKVCVTTMIPPEAGIEPGKVCVTAMIPPEAGIEPGNHDTTLRSWQLTGQGLCYHHDTALKKLV